MLELLGYIPGFIAGLFLLALALAGIYTLLTVMVFLLSPFIFVGYHLWRFLTGKAD